MRLRTQALLQCRHCPHQASLTAGRIFADAKLPLTTWLLALLPFTQRKDGISPLELKPQLGVSYPTDWRVKHKLLQAMKERGQVSDRAPTPQAKEASSALRSSIGS